MELAENQDLGPPDSYPKFGSKKARDPIHPSERVFAKCGVQSDESSGRDFNPRMSRVRTNNKTESGRGRGRTGS